MRLLDPTWIRDRVDYSFGDESGISIGGYMKPANSNNQEFMQRYQTAISGGARYMTLFIDNMRLYRRSCIRYTAVEQINPTWKRLKDEKVQRFQNEDLLQLLSTLPDMRFIIFTGFEDTPTDEAIFDAIPDNVLAIYASNAIVYGGKVYPIPYGLQRVVAPSDNRQQILEHSVPHTVQVNKLMYINYNPGNHPSRQHLINTYQNQPWVTVTIPGSNPLPQYGQYLNEFMLCPSGNADGCECHRDWETIYMRRVPIVTDTPYHRAIFEPLHVPVLYIDDLSHITEQLLLDNDYLYQQMQTYDLNQLDIEVLYNKCIEQVNEQLSKQRRCLVLGAGGFIGGHLCKRLKSEGCWIRGVDIKQHEYFPQQEFCHEFQQGDLRDPAIVYRAMTIDGNFDEVYQLAADMGGAGYIFTGEHDADVMHNSALINLNVAKACVEHNIGRVFYSSSACCYPSHNQTDPDNPNCEESSCYPANPDSEYGWEKLFSERMYKAFEKNYDLTVRIARFHNIFGPQGTWAGGKEKAPAAICRKVVEAPDVDYVIKHGNVGTSFPGPLLNPIDIWGDGTQTRSFLYIDECIEGIIRLMRSDCTEVVNIGSEEMISINDLARMVIRISGKNLAINNIPGPTGVAGRNSHNALIQQELGWSPSQPLEEGMRKLYTWIAQQVHDSQQ